MSKLSELRSRSKATRESLQMQKASRIKEQVLKTVTSGSFDLSVLDALGSRAADDKVIHDFAEQIAMNVTDTIMNPVNDFLDTCKARGLSDERVSRTVERLNEVFGLTKSNVYSDKLEAVALYMESNRQLYDDVAMLK